LGGKEIVIDDFDLEAWLKDNTFDQWLPKQRERLSKLWDEQQHVLSNVYPAIREATRNKRRKTAQKFEETHRIDHAPLEVGTKVLILDEQKSSKHNPSWIGPFRIHSVNRTGSYVVTDDSGGQMRRARAQMKLFHEDQAAQAKEQKAYELERIIRHTGSGDNVRYYVKWKGYGKKHNSWVKPEDFVSLQVVRDYWAEQAPERQRKRKPQGTNTSSRL
jgi:hypothetical protein